MIFKIASVFHKKRIAFQCPQIGVVHFLVLWKCIFSDLIIINPSLRKSSFCLGQPSRNFSRQSPCLHHVLLSWPPLPSDPETWNQYDCRIYFCKFVDMKFFLCLNAVSLKKIRLNGPLLSTWSYDLVRVCRHIVHCWHSTHWVNQITDFATLETPRARHAPSWFNSSSLPRISLSNMLGWVDRGLHRTNVALGLRWMSTKLVQEDYRTNCRSRTCNLSIARCLPYPLQWHAWYMAPEKVFLEAANSILELDFGVFKRIFYLFHADL